MKKERVERRIAQLTEQIESLERENRQLFQIVMEGQKDMRVSLSQVRYDCNVMKKNYIKQEDLDKIVDFLRLLAVTHLSEEARNLSSLDDTTQEQDKI